MKERGMGILAEHVVRGEQIVISQSLSGLRIFADNRWSRSDVGERQRRTKQHDQSPPQSPSEKHTRSQIYQKPASRVPHHPEEQGLRGNVTLTACALA